MGQPRPDRRQDQALGGFGGGGGGGDGLLGTPPLFSDVPFDGHCGGVVGGGFGGDIVQLLTEDMRCSYGCPFPY